MLKNLVWKSQFARQTGQKVIFHGQWFSNVNGLVGCNFFSVNWIELSKRYYFVKAGRVSLFCSRDICLQT